ncbi:hypothetical protein HPB51_022495 [Rhipicephalus microplus]|uniref:C2H2-type domain-containing protein n=1 Tax=Rhipicephalus microplus TaxID=6941 RepID=A0A9J6ED01_RHIMP|nr:hypothetical protein HPB51_022495 [Rhipicephalus microplus]
MKSGTTWLENGPAVQAQREVRAAERDRMISYEEITKHYRLGRVRFPPAHTSLNKQQVTAWRLLQTNTFPNPVTFHYIYQEIYSDLCSQSSATPDQYHTLVFLEDRVHSCRQCTYVSKDKGSMTAHLRKHTGERPFQCHLCPAAFSNSSNLIRHVRTHTGKRPFSCPHCNASFSQKQNLIRHVAGTHAGERPFSCAHCQKSFLLKQQLIRHVACCHSKKKP